VLRHCKLWTAVLLLLAPIHVMAQSVEVGDLAAGKLLVARETYQRFAETVILLIEYDSQGALGITINRRSDTPISAALRRAQEWSELIFLGGPVQMSSVFALLRSSETKEEMKPVIEKVYWVADRAALEKILADGPQAAEVRFYLGYSGWGAGQLDNEVRTGSWYIFDAKAEEVFDPEPATLWKRLKEKTEQRFARLR